jgi:hypothetical protein
MTSVWKPAVGAALALATAAVLGGQPSTGTRVVIVDADSPALDGAASDRIVEAALVPAAPAAATRYFQLTAHAIQEIPATDDALRLVRFDVRPPSYAGVSLTVGEAAEILRGNEAVRDRPQVAPTCQRPPFGYM